MDQQHPYHPETLAAQALGWVEPTTRAVVPPLHPSSTFERDPDNAYSSGHCYTRDTSPAYQQPEALLTALEGGAAAKLFASGMAAATAVFQALPPNARIIAPEIMYWGLREWLLDWGAPRGLHVDFVPPGDLDALAHSLAAAPTELVWLETPSNPTWVITNLEAACELAHHHGARVCVDSTVVTPIITRPLALGADLVMHSATKYLNGHGDICAGALVTAREDQHWVDIGRLRHDAGAVLGAFEAWLLLRGMRTLHLRVQRANDSALYLAQALEGHPALLEVLYPGLPSHPGYHIARRQMSGGFGGMLSIRLRGGQEAAVATAARVKLWVRATSLGGAESLIEHRASIEGPGTPVPGDLLRLAVGLEHPEDLLQDLLQALPEG